MSSAGRLQERITFQQRGLDANGEPSPNVAWQAGTTVWGRARALKGSEPVIQARLQGVQPVEFTVRSSTFSRTIDTEWRAVWGSRNYNIKAVTPDERRQFITFLAEHDQSDG